MAYNTEITACFTGHRSYRGECQDALLDAIRALYKEGYRTFLCGMAVGFDLAAAEAVLALRNELPEISLVAVIPFEGMERKFSEGDRVRFRDILVNADKVVSLAPCYSVELYSLRNNFLVDNSSAVIAYFDGSKGGTAYTVRRAIKRLHRYMNLYINPQQEILF
ncbi:MAG: DUF1273 family protein [Alistipes sp.]|nr:DUF1273 family protein [Alistipes sp.]